MRKITFETADHGTVTFEGIDPVLVTKALDAMNLVTFAAGDLQGANEYQQFIASEIISHEDAHFCEISGMGFKSFGYRN